MFLAFQRMFTHRIWINVARVMTDLVKQTCQARPSELVASTGRVPLLLPALARPELARRVQQPQNLSFLKKYDVYAYTMIVL